MYVMSNNLFFSLNIEFLKFEDYHIVKVVTINPKRWVGFLICGVLLSYPLS